MSVRKVLNRIRRLPRTSALVGAIDPDHHEWSPEAYLLAELFDVGQAANWQRGDPKAKRPERHPRPGDDRRRQERSESQYEHWRATKQAKGD